MNSIHDDKVNHTYESHSLHDILNPSRRTKDMNSHYSPVIHGFVNTHKGRARFNNFRILLDI